MFGAPGRIFVEKIEPKRVLVRFKFVKQPRTQARPFLVADLTFEYGFLNPSAIILAGLCDPTEPARPFPSDGGDIIADENQHRGKTHGKWAFEDCKTIVAADEIISAQMANNREGRRGDDVQECGPEWKAVETRADSG